MGRELVLDCPVTQKFHDTVWYSFALGLVSFILEILIAIPLGIAAARKQYSFTDYFTTVVSDDMYLDADLLPRNDIEIRLLRQARLV